MAFEILFNQKKIIKKLKKYCFFTFHVYICTNDKTGNFTTMNSYSPFFGFYFYFYFTKSGLGLHC